MTRQVLVTGATGYIGGRLVPRLLDAGHRVRCLVREPRKLDAPPLGRTTRASRSCRPTSGDVDAMTAALQGCRRRLLPRALDDRGGRRATPTRDRRLAAPSRDAAARAGRRADRLPRRSRRDGRGSQRAPRLAPRGRAGARLDPVPVTVLRAADDHRLGLGLLRDPALPRRAPAGDGHAALGAAPSPSRSRCATCCTTSSPAWTPRDRGRTLDIGGPEVADLPRRLMQHHGRGPGPAARAA